MVPFAIGSVKLLDDRTLKGMVVSRYVFIILKKSQQDHKRPNRPYNWPTMGHNGIANIGKNLEDQL